MNTTFKQEKVNDIKNIPTKNSEQLLEYWLEKQVGLTTSAPVLQYHHHYHHNHLHHHHHCNHRLNHLSGCVRDGTMEGKKGESGGVIRSLQLQHCVIQLSVIIIPIVIVLMYRTYFIEAVKTQHYTSFYTTTSPFQLIEGWVIWNLNIFKEDVCCNMKLARTHRLANFIRNFHIFLTTSLTSD